MGGRRHVELRLRPLAGFAISRKALPSRVFVVGLRERQRDAVPVPRIEAALGQGSVVRRNAPGLLQRHVRVGTEPEVEVCRLADEDVSLSIDPN